MLKGTVSLRPFFLAPKTFVKIDGFKNIYNFLLKNFVYRNLWGSLYFQKFNRHWCTSLYIWTDWIQRFYLFYITICFGKFNNWHWKHSTFLFILQHKGLKALAMASGQVCFRRLLRSFRKDRFTRWQQNTLHTIFKRSRSSESLSSLAPWETQQYLNNSQFQPANPSKFSITAPYSSLFTSKFYDSKKTDSELSALKIWGNRRAATSLVIRLAMLLSKKKLIFSYPSVLTAVFGLIVTVLLSTHNICFGWEINIKKYSHSYLEVCLMHILYKPSSFWIQ